YEDMAEWPVLMHENGSVNPYAQLPFKTTIERVISSPLIADPIRLFDCAPTGDGASALLVTTYDNAKKVTDTPVRIVGYGVGTDFISISLRERLDLLRASINASNKAYKMARVKPEDVDVAEIHDAFTIMAILSIEDLGFSKKGEGVRELKEGRFRKGDKPSINPSGGLKSRGHPVGATGIYQAAEVAMQLRGDAGPIQVDGVEVGLTQNIGGAGTSITVFIYKL
ncbi:MAG: acetyl-CoA acetyltransferase, partial [Candidatus Odinarchaeota archaeon]|nr:acetyl-CoA acetyltransferase [Candidatus Odinarchaeota archaeon]